MNVIPIACAAMHQHPAEHAQSRIVYMINLYVYAFVWDLRLSHNELVLLEFRVRDMELSSMVRVGCSGLGLGTRVHTASRPATRCPPCTESRNSCMSSSGPCI